MRESGLPAAMEIWQVEDRGVAVEYSLAVMSEIRAKVLENFGGEGRAGLESGGVLFGQRDGDTVRILAWRPILCSNSRGPSFVLSPQDEAGLSLLLSRWSRDPALAGKTPVGWFRSRREGGICLTAEDLALHQRFFPETWQVALILRPGMNGSVRGGFFFRESGGEIRTESSYREFEIEAFPGKYAAVESGPQPPPAGMQEPPARVPKPRAAPVKRKPAPAPAAPPAQGRPAWWTALWLVACALSAAVGVMIERRHAQASLPRMTLHVRDLAGQLEAEWTLHDRALAEGAQGKLVVSGGGSIEEIPLDSRTMARGRATVARRSEPLSLKLVVSKSGMPPLEETALYIGPPAADRTPPEDAGIKSRLEALESENNRLREESRREATRADQLKQQYHRLLQERLEELGRRQ